MDRLGSYNSHDIFTVFDYLSTKIDLYKHNNIINIKGNYYIALSTLAFYFVILSRAATEYHANYTHFLIRGDTQFTNTTLQLQNLLNFNDNDVMLHIFNTISKMTFLDAINLKREYHMVMRQFNSNSSHQRNMSIMMQGMKIVPYVMAKYASEFTLDILDKTINFIYNRKNPNLKESYERIKEKNANNTEAHDEVEEVKEFNKIIKEYKNKGFISNDASPSSSKSAKNADSKKS